MQQKDGFHAKPGHALFLGYTQEQTGLIGEIRKLGWKVTHCDTRLADLSGYDAIISFGYRHILKPEVLDTATVPVVNLHISLLPFNRGAHPNFWSFYDGTPSGVTIHLIDPGVDTGPVLFQQAVAFGKHELTFRQTQARLVNEIEALFVRHIESILSGDYKPQPQTAAGTQHRMKDLPEEFSGWDSVITDEITRLRRLAGTGQIDLKVPQLLFSQRIQSRFHRWWIAKQRHPHKHLGGKMTGRNFVQEMGGKVPQLHALVDQLSDIPAFDELPDKFVLKPTKGWSSKNVFLMDGGVNTLDGQAWDRERIIAHISQDPLTSHPGVQFIVEEYLCNWDGKKGTPLDYKFYMFGSRIAFIHVIERNSGSQTSKNRHWFMNGDWQPITERIVATQKPEKKKLAKPDCLEELLAVTQTIGQKLDMFMRIDMYATTRGAVFGEFTPQPHGGKGFTPWADEWLGSLWHGDEGSQH